MYAVAVQDEEARRGIAAMASVAFAASERQKAVISLAFKKADLGF